MDPTRTHALPRESKFWLTVIWTIALVAFAGSSDVQAAPVSAELVSAGGSHTCATSSGAALCWGANQSGQLGDGSSDDSSIPVQVSGLATGVTAISASGGSVEGAGSTCAIVAGAAKCWGNNDYGQLGDGSTDSSNVPVQVIGLTAGVTAITVGERHTCAVVSGAAKCWGSQSGFLNALGNGDNANDHDNADSLVPVQVTGLTSGVTAIGVGSADSCAVVAGAAKCWGSQFWGQLGNGVFGDEAGQFTDSPIPVAVTGLSSDVTTLMSAGEYNCAVQLGAARCWGEGFYSGALGDGAFENRSTPVEPTGLSANVATIAASGGHTCAVVSGSVRCWGHNERGQLGLGSTDNVGEPTAVTGLTGVVSAVSAGGGHTCAIVDGFVWCWGKDWFGELGDGRGRYERDVTMPTQVVDTVPPPPAAPIVTIQTPTEGQALSSTSTNVTFTVTGDPTTATQCQIDTADWVPCSSPWAINGLAPGQHAATVYAADEFGGETDTEVHFTVVSATPPVLNPPLPSPAPTVNKLPSKVKFAKGLSLKVTCVEACALNVVIKIGGKKTTLPKISVPAGTNSATPVKLKLSASVKKKIRAALKEKRKVTVVITPVSLLGTAGSSVSTQLK
ncbi:MAG: hypothetical protein ACRDKI_03875 [Solirubrobacterales bacterium]